MSAPRKATEIAARAAELVGGDREKQHGTKRKNFENIAAMWNAYLGTRPEPAAPLSGTDVGLMMVALKLARTQLGSLNLDDYIDGAGYMACAGEVALDLDEEARNAVEGVDREIEEVFDTVDGFRPVTGKSWTVFGRGDDTNSVNKIDPNARVDLCVGRVETRSPYTKMDVASPAVETPEIKVGDYIVCTCEVCLAQTTPVSGKVTADSGDTFRITDYALAGLEFFIEKRHARLANDEIREIAKKAA